ncbi:MAG: hypothetical protein A2Z19_02770 [Deltaproteobacteria bacterium RBG_16_54_18]|jgi:uncharacterized Tic20 family protein|nr:MAG: hypothetical protein A2Z19_02770 [Deltaproteobacteria bacterium RBG_16_54_18]
MRGPGQCFAISAPLPGILSLFAIIAAILIIVLIGFFLLFALMVFDVIMVIVATVGVNAGEKYRYPLNIRFIT